jgi:hypothetical protein
VSADVALVTLSLAGDAEAQRQLAIRLLDVVHRVVASHGVEAETIPTRVQEVFVALLERDAEALRAWDPDEGPTLEECVDELARRRIEIILGEAPGERPGEVQPLTADARESVLAKILARLDHGETLAEDGADFLAGELEAAVDLPTTTDLESPLPDPDDRARLWRFSAVQVAVTVAVAIAVASAVAMLAS